MIRNYISIAIRNFARNKNYTLINAVGLAIGITSAIVIFLMISYEAGFDKFHSKRDSIYRVVVDSRSSEGLEYSSITPYPLAKAFRNDFPGIPLVTQMHWEGEALVTYGPEKQLIDQVLFADSLFFEVFDFEVLSGNPRVDLGRPGKVFLTQSLAEKLFKIGPATDIKINNRIDLQVAGIIADPPATSHISFSMIVSMPSLSGEFIAGLPMDTWNLSSAGFVYISLPAHQTPESVVSRFPDFLKKYLSAEDASRKTYSLQPLNEIHFADRYTDNPGTAVNASTNNLVILGVVGIFILTIACINFVNLATALAIRKSKEIGIRKTLGAKRSQLTWYFLTETFFLTLISVILSLCACEWLLSWLNRFLDKSLHLDLWSNPALMVFLACLIVFTTLLSGFYPSLFLSGLNPIAILRDKNSISQNSGTSLRRVLVVFQFFIAQALVIGTLVVADQMEYLSSKPLGFEKEAIVNVPMHDRSKAVQENFRSRIEANADILSLSYSLGAPTSQNNFNTSFWKTETGRDGDVFRTSLKTVDRYYMETYGLELAAGRWFTEADEKLADVSLPKREKKFSYVVNETAMRQLGYSTPHEIVGQFISTGIDDISGEVIGVVKDFHISSLHNEIGPVVMMNLPQLYYDAGIKINPERIKATLAFIEEQWKQVYPDYYFNYTFLDDELQSSYANDEKTFTLFKIFSAISIFIGCLGLYGLVSFMANQKLKEVGIRKVLGASVNQIMVLFSKEFVKLITLAFVLAAPLTWYLMNKWLTGFAYRIEVGWQVFAISVGGTLIIALLTVCYKAYGAARSNPVETLRTD